MDELRGEQEMEKTQFSQFVEKLKTDADLRQKVVDAEQAAARDMDALKRIAADEGYDISGEIGRPQKAQPTPTAREMENSICFLTCCWIETSVWDTEGPSIGGF